MADSRELRVVVDDLTRFTRDSVVMLTLEVHANLVRAPSEGGTPVDTGFARANWVPSISAPVLTIDGSREAVSQGAAQRGLALVATQYALRDGPTYVSNNVRYIQVLNEGRSAQAPSGFVQNAVADAVRSVNRALR